ncbi:hypothetical protein IMCC1989_7 [gamma proteobacterium IMCC1989]|nr:hypothetical protein IMCC1989_7 [gamma proteobacterium IMCC1989]
MEISGLVFSERVLLLDNVGSIFFSSKKKHVISVRHEESVAAAEVDCGDRDWKKLMFLQCLTCF